MSQSYRQAKKFGSTPNNVPASMGARMGQGAGKHKAVTGNVGKDYRQHSAPKRGYSPKRTIGQRMGQG